MKNIYKITLISVILCISACKTNTCDCPKQNREDINKLCTQMQKLTESNLRINKVIEELFEPIKTIMKFRAAAEKDKLKAPKEVISTITMENIVFNVADSAAKRYASLDVTVDTTQEHVHSFKKAAEGQSSNYNIIVATTIEIASSKSLEYLTSHDQRRAFKLELKTSYNKIIEAKTGKKDAVKDVYFSKFLIQ